MGRYVFSAYFGHDASIAICGEGRIVHYEAERFTRERHGTISHELVKDLFHKALRELGIGVDEIVAIAGMGCACDFGGARNRQFWDGPLSIIEEVETEYLGLRRLPCFYMPHHMSHAAYAFYTSGFEDSHLVAIDGGGDAFWCGPDKPLEVIDTATGYARHPFGATKPDVFNLNRLPNTAVGGTWDILSTRLYGNGYQAGTIMALAGADPEAWAAGVDGYPDPVIRDTILRLQARTTSTINSLVPWGAKRVSLAGGVALNGIAVYDLLKRGRAAEPGLPDVGYDIEAVHVPPACDDGGLTVGACLAVLHMILGEPRHNYSREQVAFCGWNEPALQGELPVGEMVAALTTGQIVAVANGAAESGPRSLGHRSFLADPRNLGTKQRLNQIKSRQGFRPVAPMVLREHAADYFDLVNSECYSYMTTIARATERCRSEAPAVVHDDGSARVQVVDADTPMGKVLTAFHGQTGVPILCNTSFNLKGEAMVNDPTQARDTFKRSGADMLVIGSNVEVRR